jgi:3-hydroxypropanoate dehydrogenase
MSTLPSGLDETIVPSPAELVERKAARSLDENALRTIFLEARTANGFLDRAVSREQLSQALELALLGPTSANNLPARFVFVMSPQAKELLRPAMSPGNLDKTMAAPATAIVAADPNFHERFDRTFPDRAAMFKELFTNMPAEQRLATAWDNALLQMGYFIIALRSIGLDAGPMAGFDRAKVDAAFFPDRRFRSQYLINIGYGDDTKVFPRLPRFNVDEIARFE